MHTRSSSSAANTPRGNAAVDLEPQPNREAALAAAERLSPKKRFVSQLFPSGHFLGNRSWKVGKVPILLARPKRFELLTPRFLVSGLCPLIFHEHFLGDVCDWRSPGRLHATGKSGNARVCCTYR